MRKFSIRAGMILIALLTIPLYYYVAKDRRLASEKAVHRAKHLALQAQHEAEAKSWRDRMDKRQALYQVALQSAFHWKENHKLKHADDLADGTVQPHKAYPHTDAGDVFPIIRGPADGWDHRVKAYHDLSQQCWARANYHQSMAGLAFCYANSDPNPEGDFAKKLAEPPPTVDSYPKAYRSELKGGPIPTERVFELIPIEQEVGVWPTIPDPSKKASPTARP